MYSEFVEECRGLTKEILEEKACLVTTWMRIRPIVMDRVQLLNDPELLIMALKTGALDAEYSAKDWGAELVTVRELIGSKVASVVCFELVGEMED